ncbi:200 kDa antigen p200 [Paraburkholderia tropica]
MIIVRRSEKPLRLLALINLRALLDELDGLHFHAFFQGFVVAHALLRREVAHVLRDLHRAEVRAAHRAEVRDLGRVLRQRFVVEFTRLVRIEAEVELVFPAELETRLRERVVAHLRARMTLREIGRVRRELVRDDAFLHVVLVRQTEVFLRRDVAEHRRAEPADHRRADARSDVIVARRDVGGQRPERVERRFLAPVELEIHVLLDELHRHVAGAFDHHLHVVLPRDLREFAERLQFAELRFVVGVVDRAGTQAVAEREAHVVGLHDFADLFEMLVNEGFLMVREAPLGHDRTTARDDARHAVGRERHVLQTHARVNREVVDALLGLLDQRVAEHFPREVFSLAVDLFERLIDRHRADRHRRIADDPLARFMNVLAGRQIHDRVAAPADRPRHLVDFLADRRRDRRVADVRVDLHEEVAADDHRFAFRVVDVRGDDRAAACDLVAHEFRRDFLERVGAERRCAERLARMLAAHHRRELCAVRAARLEAFEVLGATLVFADRDVLHFGRDDALTRVVHLRDVLAGLGAARRAVQARETQFGRGRIGGALAAVVGGEARQRFSVAALFDPRLAQRRQTRANVDLRFGIGVRTRGVVDVDRRILLAAEARGRVGLRDLAHRHADVGLRAGDVDLAGIGQRRDRGFVDVRVGGNELGIRVHASLSP